MLSHVVPSLAKLDQAAPQLGFPVKGDFVIFPDKQDSHVSYDSTSYSKMRHGQNIAAGDIDYPCESRQELSRRQTGMKIKADELKNEKIA